VIRSERHTSKEPDEKKKDTSKNCRAGTNRKKRENGLEWFAYTWGEKRDNSERKKVQPSPIGGKVSASEHKKKKKKNPSPRAGSTKNSTVHRTWTIRESLHA